MIMNFMLSSRHCVSCSAQCYGQEGDYHVGYAVLSVVQHLQNFSAIKGIPESLASDGIKRSQWLPLLAIYVGGTNPIIICVCRR